MAAGFSFILTSHVFALESLTVDNMKEITAQSDVSIVPLANDFDATTEKVNSVASKPSATSSDNLPKGDKRSYSRHSFDIPARKYEISGSAFSSEYGKAIHTGSSLQVLSGHIEVGS